MRSDLYDLAEQPLFSRSVRSLVRLRFARVNLFVLPAVAAAAAIWARQLALRSIQKQTKKAN